MSCWFTWLDSHPHPPCSDRQTKHAHYTVHGLILPSNGAAAVGCVVPEAGAGCVETGAVLLHNHTRHDIFKWFR